MGILSLVKLPVTQFPSISPPKVNITAEYPGANNELLIKSVVIPLERGLNGVPGMKYMTSDAGNDGEASIRLYSTLEQTRMLLQSMFRTVYLRLLTSFRLWLSVKG
jgi:multidrug efflux pump subunit AcrB